MDNEKSSAEKTKIFAKPPIMIVIKGKQTEHLSLSAEILYKEFKKFARIKENTTFFLRLPLDSLLKKTVKRSADVILSTIVITTILSWLIPLVAILIKLDSKGPVFFWQKRNKRNGKIFTCIKFRSMIENEDADNSPLMADDERITHMGRFLRKHYLDELPQFFNVWMGDMSFIGPRSYSISDNNKYEESIGFYDFRHKVKPGIIGLAQVLGFRGETKHVLTIRDRVQLDIFYVRHWSIGLDIKIFWHSLRKLVKT